MRRYREKDLREKRKEAPKSDCVFLKVVIFGMHALRRFGEGHPQVHAAEFAVGHVDERVDGLFQRRHRDVRHFPIVLEKLFFF